MRTLPKDGDGDLMLRMAAIEAQLADIARSSLKGATFSNREAKAVPLRKELAKLHQRLWGTSAGA